MVEGRQNAELIELKTSDRLILPGILYEPQKKSRRAVIYLHGNGNSNVFYSQDFLAANAAMFASLGWAFLAFNNRGALQMNKISLTDGKKVLGGTAYEKIKDCVKDIDAAISFLRAKGYSEFILEGFSTGANKICVYNYYKQKNSVSGYIIVSGGDDAGIYYKILGREKYLRLLKLCKNKIGNGKGKELMPISELSMPYSYQSFYDIANPDGDYNNFPFNEYFKNLKLSKRKLFRHFSSIKKPSLVIYGDLDEYSWTTVSKALEVLRERSSASDKISYSIIKGADHGYTGKQKEFLQEVKKWLIKI